MRHRHLLACLLCVAGAAFGCRNSGMNTAWKPSDPSMDSDLAAADRDGGPHGQPLHGMMANDGARPPQMARDRADGRLADSSAPSNRGNDRPNSPSKFNAVTEHLDQGRFEASRGNLDQAKLHLTRVLKDQPDHPEAHHRLGVIADKQRRYPEAESHYLAALRSSPRDANVYSDLGYSYLLQGRYPQSEQALNEALRIDPQHSRAMNNLGMLYAKQGDSERALALFRRTGDEQKAHEKLARALRPDPGTSPLGGNGSILASGSSEAPNELTARIKADMERARAEMHARNSAGGSLVGAPDPRSPRGYGAIDRVANADQPPQSRQLDPQFDPRSRPVAANHIPDQSLNDVFSAIDSEDRPSNSHSAARPNGSWTPGDSHAGERVAANRYAPGAVVIPESYRGSVMKPATYLGQPRGAAPPATHLDSNAVWPPSAQAHQLQPTAGVGRPAAMSPETSAAVDAGVETAMHYENRSPMPRGPYREPAGQPESIDPRMANPDVESQRLATRIGMGTGPGGMFPVLNGSNGQPPLRPERSFPGSAQPPLNVHPGTGTRMGDSYPDVPRMNAADMPTNNDPSAFAPNLESSRPMEYRRGMDPGASAADPRRNLPAITPGQRIPDSRALLMSPAANNSGTTDPRSAPNGGAWPGNPQNSPPVGPTASRLAGRPDVLVLDPRRNANAGAVSGAVPAGGYREDPAPNFAGRGQSDPRMAGDGRSGDPSRAMADPRSSNAISDEGWGERMPGYQPDALPVPMRTPRERGLRPTPADRISPVNPWSGRGTSPEPASQADEFRRQAARHDADYNASLQQIEAERRAVLSSGGSNGSQQYYSPTREELRTYDDMRREVGTRYQSESMPEGNESVRRGPSASRADFYAEPSPNSARSRFPE